LYASVFADASFPSALLALDHELAETTRQQGCPWCGGPLHSAAYLRKPRGGPWEVAEELAVRHSFCCARDGCRRRVLPPSVRFLGRRVYLGAVVVLGAVLQHGASAARLRRLSAVLGIDRRTLTRWRQWWLRQARSTSGQVSLRVFMPPVDVDAVPRSLLERFSGSATASLTSMLRWLCGSGFCREPISPAEDAR